MADKADQKSRADIAGAIAAKFDIPLKQADEITREYEAAILRAVAEGQEVRLNGFGAFKVIERQARQARNPQTGEMAEVPAKKVAKFAAAKAMRDAVNGGEGTAKETPKGTGAEPEKAAGKAKGSKTADKADADASAEAAPKKKAPAKKKS